MVSQRVAFLLLPLFLSVLTAPVRASGTWDLRNFPTGSATIVKGSNLDFVLVGSFDDGPRVESRDGGFSWETGFGLPDAMPADSIRCLTLHDQRLYVLSRSGQIWRGRIDSRRWNDVSTPADSFGIATAIHDVGFDTWIGTEKGWLLRRLGSSEGWAAITHFDSIAVREIGLGQTGSLVALLGDGRVFAQDSTWVEAPFRASTMAFNGEGQASELGYAIEEGSHGLWKTTNGGIDWAQENSNLETPELAHHVDQVQTLVLRPDGLGLMACRDVLLASEDRGLTWRVAAAGSDMFLDVAIDDLDEIVTAGSRIHRSTDRAWSVAQTMGGDFSRVEIGSIYAYWAIDEGLLFSANRGDSWWRQPLPAEPGDLKAVAVRGAYQLWLHFDGPTGIETYYSDNRGIDYQLVDPDRRLSGMIDWSLSSNGDDGPFSAPGVFWAFDDSTLLRSTDGGREWEVVLENLSGARSLATNDSLHAAVCGADWMAVTSDGGESWQDAPLPLGVELRALSFSSDTLLVGVGDRITLMEARPPWEVLDHSDFGETLHDVAITDDGIGWVVGDSGLILETSDGGRSWSRYAVDLEITHLDVPLTHISVLDGDHATTGGGATLLRFIPDGWGPEFHFGISVNPHLNRYLDIHITAQERLLGDSLHVEIDGVPIEAIQFDPDGFLFRVHYHVPPRPGEMKMVAQGSDWSGNPHTETISLSTSHLDASGVGQIVWSEERLRIQGDSPGLVALLEDRNDEPRLPAPWIPVGRPFRIAVSRGATIQSATDGHRLAVRQGESWSILPDEPLLIDLDAVYLCIGGATEVETQPTQRFAVRIYPVPARERLNLRVEGWTLGPCRWEIVDLVGRRCRTGESLVNSNDPIEITTTDADGRRLPAGVYWLRVRSPAGVKPQKFLVTR